MSPRSPRQLAAGRRPQELIPVALGKAPADLLIRHAGAVNVYTGEIQEDITIAVKGAWIAFSGHGFPGTELPHGEIVDAGGKVVIPGLIDGHTHLAWMCSVPQLLECIIPGGTTTIITESMEIYPVAGVEGVFEFLDSLADQPIKIFATAPAMVSISPAAAGIPEGDLEKILDRPEIIGLGESYWQGIFHRPEVFLGEYGMALARGKTLEGHSAGASAARLQAYAACGVSSCHEPISESQALERMRLGMHVMAREGSIRRDLEAISKIKDRGLDLRRLTVSTDGVEPEDLLRDGYMENLLRKAVRSGFDPVTAVQMVTLNVAEHFGIQDIVGGIGPGKMADMVILSDLETLRPEAVISNGRLIAREGVVMSPPREHEFSKRSRRTIHINKEIAARNFDIPARLPGDTEVRIIHMKTDLVTADACITRPVVDGKFHCDPSGDILKVAAVDRTHVPGRTFTALIRGFGMRSGAMACSAAWDTSDIVVVGADEKDMALCVNRIIQLQGGAVISSEGRIMEELPLPVFGLISELSIPEMASKIRALNQAAQTLGVGFPDPLLSLVTLTCAAIPFLRICDQGLVNLKDGTLTGMSKA